MDANPSIDNNHNLHLGENQPASPVVKAAKAPRNFTRSDMILALAMLVIGYLFIKMIICSDLGLGATVFSYGLIAAAIYWLKTSPGSDFKACTVYLALLLLSGAYFLLFDNQLFKNLNLLLLLCLFAYMVLAARSLRLEHKLGQFLLVDLFNGLLYLPLRDYGSAAELLRRQVSKSKNWRNILLIALGIIIALPVSIYVVAMLQNADQAFANLWQRLGNDYISKVIINIAQFAIALPVSFYFFALLFGAKQNQEHLHTITDAQKLATNARFLPQLLVIGALTPLIIIYVIFFCSQSAYFLSAFQGLLPQGYIHAEYARQGFFELCNVSTVNFIMILVLNLLAKKDMVKHKLLSAYSIILALFSIAMIVIALRKMLLYIEHFGLTPLRLYTSCFMLLLLLIFAFIIVRTLNSRFAVVKWSAIATVTLFLLLAFSNPDMQIARYNVARFADGSLEDLDVWMLKDLGSAAIPYLIEITTMPKAGELRQAQAADILDREWQQGAHRYNDLRAFNLQYHYSLKLLASYIGNQALDDSPDTAERSANLSYGR